MTTFKDAVPYADLLYTGLLAACAPDSTTPPAHVIANVRWFLKGGSMEEAVSKGTVAIDHSGTEWPHGYTVEIGRAKLEWDQTLAAWESAELAGASPQRPIPTPKQKELLRQYGLIMDVVKRRRAGMHNTKKALSAKLATCLAVVGTPSEPHLTTTGAAAVWAAFSEVWSARKHAKSPAVSTMEKYCKELVVASAYASNLDGRDAAVFADTCAVRMRELKLGFLVTEREAVLRAIYMARSGAARARAARAGSAILDLDEVDDYDEDEMTTDPSVAKAYFGGRTYSVAQGVAYTTGQEGRRALVVSDMTRLLGMIVGATSSIVAMVAQHSTGTPKNVSRCGLVVGAYVANVDAMIALALSCKLGDEVLACKTMKRAFAAHLGSIAGTMCADETNVLIAEAETTMPGAAKQVKSYLQRLRGLTAQESFNAGKAYKIAAPPDSSPGAMVLDRMRAVCSPNRWDPVIMGELDLEILEQGLSARIRDPGPQLARRAGVPEPPWWRSYIKREYHLVPLSDLDRVLAWEGSCRTPERDPLDPGVWKDSSLGADSYKQAVDPNSDRKMLNMLQRMIVDQNCPTPDCVLAEEGWEHSAKMFSKSENHKDPSRAIFSSCLKDRFLKSLTELCVEGVMKHHPSFMVGADTHSRLVRQRLLATPPSYPMWLAAYYSFDVSGWSAKMPREVQLRSHAFWERMYGNGLFDKADAVMYGTRLYVRDKGYEGWFKNPEANLEGFDGKEMTVLNICMLSLTVKRWRRKVVDLGVLDEPTAYATAALLLAYIDDGVARMDFPAHAYVACFNLFKTVCVETFAGCGFVIEISKCFPSDTFYIFLNEATLAGTTVVHGVRAATTMCASAPEEYESLIERTNKAATGARGAIVAGLDAMAASYLMAFYTGLQIREWIPKTDPVMLAAWALAPRSMGGLGLPTAMQLKTTASGDAMSEGVATLQVYARVNPAVRPYVLSLFRTPFRPTTRMGLAVAPLSAGVVSGYMSDSMVAVAVRKGLEKMAASGKISPTARTFLSYGNVEAFSAYCSSLMDFSPGDTIQEALLCDVGESHFHAVFMAFCSRMDGAQTLRYVAGAKAMREICRKVREQARDSYDVALRRRFGVVV